MNPEKAKKLLTFAKDPQLALFNELQQLNEQVHKVSLEGAEIVTIKGVKGDKGDDGKNGRDGKDGEIGPMGPRGPQGESIRGEKGETGAVGPMGPIGPQGERGLDGKDGKNGSPDTGFDIVDKINSLPTNEDDYLIDVEHIRGLKKAVEKWGRSETHITSGKGKIKNYDLSSQLNGITTTFSLPANWTVISVVSSSFPSAFRPVIDYTFTPTSITFTNQIEPSTTLASGQTLIVIYEEA